MDEQLYQPAGRLISPDLTPGESEELSLRPRTLEDYIGQEKVKENLRIYLKIGRAHV